MKQCPKCGVLIKNSTHFHRHVKRCETDEHRVQCPFCSKSYSRNDDLKKHIKQKHPQPTTAIPRPAFTCEKCQKTFCYQTTYDLHCKHCGIDKPFQCSTCGKCFVKKATLEKHVQEHQQTGGGIKRKNKEEGQTPKKLPKKVTKILPADKEVSSMKGAKVDAFFYPKTQGQLKDQQVFFKETKARLHAHLRNVLEKKSVKWNLVYHVTLTMHDSYQQEMRTHQGYFRTPHPLVTLYPQQLPEQLSEAMETVSESMSIFAQAGSGWTLEANRSIILEMVDYRPIGGTSYIELPKNIFDTKSIVNVQNDDQQCFMWAVLAALHPADFHAERVIHYEPYTEELNFTGIEFPVTVDQISKFERLNPEISVTVLGIDIPDNEVKEASKVFPLRVPNSQQEHHIVLLYWSRGDVHHYAWVKNLNRLLSSSKTHRTQTFFCERCFQGFTKSTLLSKHQETCRNIPIQAVQLVDEEISFKSWSKTEECLFRIYADFECLLQECQEGTDKTQKVQKHIPCSVAWVLISDHPEVDNRQFLYRPTPEEGTTLEECSSDVVDQ